MLHPRPTRACFNPAHALVVTAAETLVGSARVNFTFPFFAIYSFLFLLLSFLDIIGVTSALMHQAWWIPDTGPPVPQQHVVDQGS